MLGCAVPPNLSRMKKTPKQIPRDLDNLARECERILQRAGDESLRLAAVEELRKIAETKTRVVPSASREEILRSFTNAELKKECERRGLQLVIHVVFDERDGEPLPDKKS